MRSSWREKDGGGWGRLTFSLLEIGGPLPTCGGQSIDMAHKSFWFIEFRTTGYRQIIEVHLLFPRLTSVSEAHASAIILQVSLPPELRMRSEGMTPLNRWKTAPGAANTDTTQESLTE